MEKRRGEMEEENATKKRKFIIAFIDPTSLPYNKTTAHIRVKKGKRR